MGGSGGVHLPGGMAGSHFSGGPMGGGVHYPSNMAGGVHIPGNLAGAAHIPANLAGQAHVPGAIRPAGGNRYAFREPGLSPHPASTRPSYQDLRGSPREMPTHVGGRGEAFAPGHQPAGPRPAFFADPRLGGHFPVRTVGFQHGFDHAQARPYLRPPADRDIGRDRDFVARHEHDFHTRDVRAFDHREFERWRHGLWRNEWHYGRRGWWWDVDGVWYDYPDPIFPYPLVVTALTVYEQPVIDGPDLQVEELPSAEIMQASAPGSRDVATPTQPVIAPLPPPPPGRYACADPSGFFPDLSECHADWTLMSDAQNAQATPPP